MKFRRLLKIIGISVSVNMTPQLKADLARNKVNKVLQHFVNAKKALLDANAELIAAAQEHTKRADSFNAQARNEFVAAQKAHDDANANLALAKRFEEFVPQ